MRQISEKGSQFEEDIYKSVKCPIESLAEYQSVCVQGDRTGQLPR